MTGYSTFPSLLHLSQLTDNELLKVTNFTVLRREFGKIVWDGETDVRDLNLDEIIEIGELYVSVYHKYPKSDIPKVGSKLNKGATVTLYKCK